MKHFSKLSKLSFLMSLTAFLLLAASPAYAANVFETITGRAVGVLTGVKQLVFVLAGFGIIAFAFMAIFGKLSWKHFANIAIGLFLVASMGLFIQYFVTKDGTSYKLSYGNYLGSAFGDTAGTVGDSFGGADGSLNPDGSFGGGNGTGTGVGAGGGGAEGGAGTETSGGQLGFDPVTGMPSLGLETTAPDTGLAGMNTELPSSSAEKKEKRGFKGFISDVKNIANAAQQAKSAVDAGINFAKNAAATYENVKNSVENNGTGIKGLLNSASDIAGGVKDLKQGAVSTVSTVGAKISGTANAIQDVGKTQEQIRDNNINRIEGTQTNKVSEWLSREGEGGSFANKVADRINATTNPVLNNTGSAAYDIKGVVTMAGSGNVSGIVGAAAGVAAGVGGILGSRGENDSMSGANAAVDNYKNAVKDAQEKLSSGEITQKEFDKITSKAKKKMQHAGVLGISDDPLLNKSSTPTLDRLKETSSNSSEKVSGWVTSDGGNSDADKWSEDNNMVQKGELLIDGQEWDYNMETGEIYNPATGETKSKEEYHEAIAEGKVLDAAAVKRNNAESECWAKSSQGYVWNGSQCLSPSQVTVQKQKEEAVQNEKNKKCPEGQRWVDDPSGMSGRPGWCVDTAETEKKKKEEAARKRQDEQNRLKNNPDAVNQIAALEKQRDAEEDACWEQYDQMRDSCDGLQNPEYTYCLTRSDLKQNECNNVYDKYQSKIAAIKAKA